MKTLNQFFVYGTLMTGCRNHDLFEDGSIVSVEEAEVKGMDLHIYRNASFPCMVLSSDKEKKVYGQLVTISDEFLEETIQELDRLEGFYEPNSNHNFYERVQSICKTSEGLYKQCYMYLFNSKNGGLGELLKSGKFQEYLGKGETV